MKYIIEIINADDEVIYTKKTYTIEELKEFYKNEYSNFVYRIYVETYINLWSVNNEI